MVLLTLCLFKQNLYLSLRTLTFSSITCFVILFFLFLFPLPYMVIYTAALFVSFNIFFTCNYCNVDHHKIYSSSVIFSSPLFVIFRVEIFTSAYSLSFPHYVKNISSFIYILFKISILRRRIQHPSFYLVA